MKTLTKVFIKFSITVWFPRILFFNHNSFNNCKISTSINDKVSFLKLSVVLLVKYADNFPIYIYI